MNLTELRTRLRGFSLATVLWLFGLATTTLLVSGWGRAVASDQATLTEGTRAVVEADLVAGRITDWITDGIVGSTDLAEADVRTAVEYVWLRPEAGAALDALVGQVVEAALGSPAGTVVIDVPGTVAPLVPVVVQELAAAGYQVDPPEVMRAVERIDPIVIDTESPDHPSSIIADARVFLTTALGVAVTAMVLLGGAAVLLASDRTVMVRSLGNRVFLGAIGFLLFQRIAVWASDPLSGRSPLFAGGNVVAGSNVQVPLLVAGMAVPFAATAWLTIRRRRSAVPAGEAADPTPHREPALTR
jgi:hypothetical protein